MPFLRFVQKHRLIGSSFSLLGLVGLAFLLLPLVALLTHAPLSTMWETLSDRAQQAISISISSTLLAVFVIILLGTPLGWQLARNPSPKWRLVEFFLYIPLLMPPLVIGLLLVYFYGPYGMIGSVLAHLQISASNSDLAIVIAEIYEAMPYYIFSSIAAFSQVDQSLERTALALGLTPWHTFWRVTLPLAFPGLTVGVAMAFARALGAFGAVIIVAYDPHTLPVEIWISLEEQGLPTALPLALILLLIALPLPLLTVLWRTLYNLRKDRIEPSIHDK